MLIESEEANQVREQLDSRRRGWRLHYLVDWEGYGLEERWSMRIISWTPHSQSFTGRIRRDWPLDHMVDPDVTHLLASGATRRGVLCHK